MVCSYSGEMYHTQSYSDGMARSDGNTDIMLAGLNGNTTLLPMTIGKFLREKPFRDTMEESTRLQLFLDKAVTGYENGTITGDAETD